MRARQIEVVVRSVQIGGHCRNEIAPILFSIRLTQFDSGDLGHGIRRARVERGELVLRHLLHPSQGAGPVAQGQFDGLDQLNLGPLPRSLAGRGEVEVVVTVDVGAVEAELVQIGPSTVTIASKAGKRVRELRADLDCGR